MARKIKRIVVVGLALVLSGCETMDHQSKENIGMAVGAIAGAVLGNQLAGDNKQWAALLGAAGGALIGKTLGRMLDERDQQRLAASTYESLRTGESQSWHNPETGVTAKTSVKETITERKNVQVKVLKDKVQTTPPMDFIGEEYSANSTVNVRGGPDTDYVIVDTISKGEHINVVGQVTGKPWYMVSRNGVGSGYVYSSLLALVPPENWSVAEVETETPDSQVNVVAITATRDCRVVSQEITMESGKTANEDVTACRGPNGWEIV